MRNIKVTVGQKNWYCLLAENEEELQSGLSNEILLAPMSGMLFDLKLIQSPEVTTEKMKFPIDIICITSSGQVSDIYRNVKPGLISFLSPCLYFMEINAFESVGIYKGDQVKFEIFNEEDEF